MKDRKELLVENLLIENYEIYYRLAYSYVHNEEDALDIVQEGAYKAILRCDTLREERFAKTWIYRIMLNEIFSLCRKQDRAAQMDMETREIEETASSGEERILLSDAIEQLLPQEKAVVELRYFEDMKLDEIAMVLDENLSTVKSRLYRALEKLRISMSE